MGRGEVRLESSGTRDTSKVRQARAVYGFRGFACDGVGAPTWRPFFFSFCTFANLVGRGHPGGSSNLAPLDQGKSRISLLARFLRFPFFFFFSLFYSCWRALLQSPIRDAIVCSDSHDHISLFARRSFGGQRVRYIIQDERTATSATAVPAT